MTTMCNFCDSETRNLSSGEPNNLTFCKECDKNNASALNGEHPQWNASESAKGDSQVLMSTQTRGNGVKVLDTGQCHLKPPFAEQLEEVGSSVKSPHFTNTRNSLNGTWCRGSTEGNCEHNSLAQENHGKSCSDKGEEDKSIVGNTPCVSTEDDSVGSKEAIDSKLSFLFDTKLDPAIWMPPEPEDMDHDGNSIAKYDDDGTNDYTDGTKWGQPSSLCSLDGENTNRHSHKEERQKAMMGAMNGQFMTIVSQLLDSEGMGLPHRENGENWLELVTSLAWEAAQLIKPYSDEGPAMDPLSYVKVKCIASGACSQSQVIKGLVFKKNTTHKHMTTKFKHPRLLLFQGALTHSPTGLSSFKHMDQEVDYTKLIIEMIETCHPDVVLVEKTVSRDIQEYLLEKGITLVSDMKLPRLTKVALCTGSEIISSANVVVRPKLKQCDSFYVEKFVEEHNSSGEGGKKPNKTLMFLEGCPKPLGCTILLKGAHSDELKKVKRVIHSAVSEAYHLILETMYFFDQRTPFTDMNVVGEVNSTSNKVMPSVTSGVPSVITDECSLNGSKSDMALTCTVEVPVSGSLDIPILEGKLNLDFGEFSVCPRSDPVVTSAIENGVLMYPFYDNHEGNVSNSSVQVSPGKLLSSVSASLRKFLVNNLPLLKTESIVSYFGYGALVSPNEEICRQGEGENGKTNQVEPDDGTCNSQKSSIAFDHSESTADKVIDEMQSESEVCNKGEGADGKTEKEEPGDEIRYGQNGVIVFDHSKTTENCSDEVADEIQTERKSDTGNASNPQSILVLLSSHCIPRQMVCKWSHLSRIKYYGNFDVSLGRYLHDTFFNQHNCSTCGEPPEAHEYRYTHQNGNITVLVTHLPKNATLPGENEGKIWMWTRCLRCEHENGLPRSTQRVLMSSEARGLSFGKFLELSFSSYYAVSMLSKCGHELQRDCLRFFGLGSKVAMFRYSPVEVYAASKMPQVLEFFNSCGQEWFAREARDILSKGDILFMEAGNILKKLKPKCSSNSCSTEKLDEVQKMLIRDRTEFEASLLKAINHAEPLGGENQILDLNWLIQELLLMLYVWDHRLHFIFSCTRDSDLSNGTSSKEKLYEANDVISSDYLDRNMRENGTFLEGSDEISVDIVEFSSRGSHLGQNHAITGTQHEAKSTEAFGYTAKAGCLTGESSPDSMAEECSLIGENISRNACELKCITILEDIRDNNTVPIVIGPLETVEGIPDFENSEKPRNRGEMDIHQESKSSKLEDSESWIWAPFSKVRKTLKMDLYGGFLQKFEFINTYTPSYLSPMHQLANQVRSSLHFPVGPDGNVISVVEDEISSIIACSLALYEDLCRSLEKKPEKEGKKVKVDIDMPIDNSHTVSPNGSTASSQWSATGFLESELASLGSDLSLFMNRIIPIENLHPEISFGSGEVPGKSKYSVVCIYGKQFYNLRKRCCSSEKAYISSLSRCKKWDAQGGKSKVLFAKTMDDRFIIKQIKKPELQSFLKFGPDYFKHVNVCLDSGSQICLAKVLGLYQVKQYKSGKEVRTDVVVMENLFFGRSITCKYDLKGALFSRYVKKSNDSESVLLDENFVEDMRVSPIYVSGKTKHLLERAIWNDTAFLTSNNVMDYSLLVGIDSQKHEIVFGIIDYLRQYTWDKHLETWVKAYLVVPKNELPTVISPKEYKKRFRKFMTKYFLTVSVT